MLSSLRRAAALAVAALGLAAAAAAQTPLERGTYLVNSISACANCHTMKGPPGAGMDYAGGFVIGDNQGPFRAVASNITPDPETGIGRWTDEQIVAAVRNGRRPDGTVVGPPMAIELYNKMSDEDVRAIVAYLRTLKPIRNQVAKSAYRIPLGVPPPARNVSAPPRTDKVAYGGYLAGPLGHCIECHTPQLRGRRDYANQLGAGGFELDAPGGGKIVAANITPDRETGIGAWTDAQIKAAITDGVRPDGAKLSPPMAYGWYKNIAPGDLDAIVAYLRSLKPIKHKVR